MTVPEMAVSGFVVNRQYVRMEAPENSVYAGFWAEVRQNLTNGERKTLMDALQAISEREQDERAALSAEIDAMQAEIEERRTANAPQDKAFITKLADLTGKLDVITDRAQRDAVALVVPHVKAWNAVEMDGDEVRPIPPPCEGGMASIDAITADMGVWLCGALLSAYRSGKGVRTPAKKPDDLPPPVGGPKRAKGGGNGASGSRRSRQSSNGLSASAFQA